MKTRFVLRDWLNNEIEDLSGSITMRIQEFENKDGSLDVDASIEIRDCSRGITLDFDLAEYMEDREKTVKNNLEKINMLKKLFGQYSTELKKSYARAMKPQPKKRRVRKNKD